MQISIEKRYDNYLNTLRLCSSNEKVWFEIHEPELIKENDEWKRVNMLADRILGSRGIY